MNKSLTLGIAASVMLGGTIVYVSSTPEINNGTQISMAGLTPVAAITHGHGLAVDAFEANKLYIATHQGLLVLLDDRNLYQIGKSKDDYMGFSADPTKPNTFFSSGHPSYGGNIGFQKSEDGGRTWRKVSNGVGGPVDFHAMAVSPANPDYLYGWYQGNIQRSTDGGVNWEIVGDSVLAVQLVADPKDVTTIYGASSSDQGVLVSRDGGVRWSVLSTDLVPGQVSAIAVSPTGVDSMLVFSEKLRGLARSTDRGITWKKVPASFDGMILHISFSPKDPLIVYALTHTNSLYKSVDGGEIWKKILPNNI